MSDIPVFQNREQVDFRYWAEKHIITEKRNKLEFQRHKILTDLYDCWADRIVIKKSAQVGATTYGILRALWLGKFNKVVVIFTMPKSSDISDFSQARVNPIVRYSGIEANVDNVRLKQIESSFIHLRGTWGETEAISVPADLLIHDEIDRSKPDVIEMYEERLSASELKWKVLMSTPTIPNFGISAEFQKSDQREWVVKCPAGHSQIIRESNIKDGEFRCIKCGRILNRANGHWEKRNPKSEIAGFHITQLIAPWISAKDIIKKRNDYKFKRDYYNFVLGEEYAGGSGMVTRADIISCVKNITDYSGKAVVGVDWGDTSWAVVRKGNRIIHLAKITDDTRKHAQRVAELMEKFRADAVCDFGYGDTKNKQLIDWFPGRVWMCVYSDGVIFPKFNKEKHIVNIDRTRSIEEELAEIKDGTLEIQPQDLVEDFIQHHLNLASKKVEDKHGKIRTIIERSGPDHFVHANNYSRLLQGTEMPDLTETVSDLDDMPDRDTEAMDW